MFKTAARFALLALVPCAVLAEPLRASLIGDYRPLTGSEAEAPQDGFEAALLAMLAGSRGFTLTDDSTAELRLGAGEAGETYYASEASALAATEGGPRDWSALAGQTFCIRAGSPYEADIAARFDARPRRYPSAAQALIGLKLGECSVVVEDRLLLENIAALPEWQRYSHQFPVLEDQTVRLQVTATDAHDQSALSQTLTNWRDEGKLAELTQYWIDEVAFQAYVLADTLDCH